MKTLSFLLKHKFTFVLFIYFFFIAYFQLHFSDVVSHKYECISISLNAASLIAVLHFIAKSRRIVAFILLFFFSILISFEALYGFLFRCIISVGTVSSVMEANMEEAVFVVKELAQKFLILFCLSFFLVFLSSKEIKKSDISVKWSMLLLFSYLFIAFPLYVSRRVKNDELFASIFRDMPALAYQVALSQKCPLIYGQLSSMVVYYGEKRQMKKYPLQERSLPEGIYMNDQNRTPEKIFLIIGESACRKHMSVYGYDVQTTPFLDSLSQNTANIMSIYDGVSPANLTRNAIRLLLTFATPMDMHPAHTQKNIIELANQAGYQTIWLSNQSNHGWHSNFATLLSTLAHVSHFTGHEPEFETVQIDDLTLIPLVKNYYSENAKQFFLIHLMGSHFDYTFRSDEIDKKHIKGDDKISGYDRSIHHTDRVIREIYHIMQKDTSALLYYVSDHGQSFEHLGHGFLDSHISQFEVPMVVIHPSKLMNVDSIVNQYFQNDKTWINTLSTIHIVAGLMGYSFTDSFITHVREQGKYIYHVDSQVYRFEDLLEKSKK